MQVTWISLLTVSLLIAQSVAQRDEGLDDYGPEGAPNADDPNAGAAGKADGAPQGEAGAEGDKNLDEEDPNQQRTKFSDNRFAKLFPARTGARNFVARNVEKPKPTLPSFIKNTPELLKVQVSTTPLPRHLGRATQVTPRRSSTTTTPRPRRGNLPTARQLSGRLSSSPPLSQRPTQPPSTAASSTPSAAALAAARRLRQGNGISRFQRGQGVNPAPNNATIPALNPRRN